MSPETRTYDKHWIPWLKKELSIKGIVAETPLMPNPWTPNYAAFKTEFEKYSVSEYTTLVGHSCGCAFLVQWLGDTKQQIQKLILIAPWKISDGNSTNKKLFYEYQIDKSISSRVGEILIFTSDDEEEGGKKSVQIFHEALGGKIIELPNHGHYTIGDMGTEKFPELLEQF